MDAARASYDRCCKQAGFPEGFYEHFFRLSPQAEPLFAQTDFDKQVKLLRHALGSLLIFPKYRDQEPNLLTRVAERHSRQELDVDPSYYSVWVDALVATVQERDPEFTPAVEEAWRATVAAGVAYMQSKY
jgi:hemoglobin-like flavoprotein